MQNSSQQRRRNSAPPHPNPAEAHRLWRGERSKPVRLGVRAHHTRSLCAASPAQTEQWCCWIDRRRIISASAENRGNSCQRKRKEEDPGFFPNATAAKSPSTITV